MFSVSQRLGLVVVGLCFALIVSFVDSASSSFGRAKISAVSLLLPLDVGEVEVHGKKELILVSALVSASPGCYYWSSTNPEVADIDFNHASGASYDRSCDAPLASKAIITVKSNATRIVIGGTEQTFGSCKVIAYNPISDESLSVEVYTMPISRIEILTTVRRLALFEVETLEVQAFDEKGNVFSSLNGLGFAWKAFLISRGNEDEANSPLVVQKISETQVAAKSALQQEFYGNFDSRVQIAGMRPGRGLIRVTLMKPGIAKAHDKSISVSAEVQIDVVEPLVLCPTSPVLLEGSKLQLQAMRKKSTGEYDLVTDSNTYEFVLMPYDSSQGMKINEKNGDLRVENSGISTVVFRQKGYESNYVLSQVRAVPFGEVRLWLAPFDSPRVHHQSNEMAEVFCQWTAFGRLPQAKSLPLFSSWISMDRERWVVTKGQRYFVMATLQSNHLNETQTIFVTPDMDFSFDTSSVSMAKNEKGMLRFVNDDRFRLPNIAVVEAADNGYAKVSVRFQFPGKVNHDVSVEKQIQITNPVQLLKPIIRLPVDLSNKVFHSYRLQVSGGTGFFTCHVLDEAQVSQDECFDGNSKQSAIEIVDSRMGIVQVRENVDRQEVIEVRDMFDGNSCRASVLISEPTQIRFSEEHVTMSFGEELPLSAVFLDSDREPYDNCTGFQGLVEWSVEGSILDLVEPQSSAGYQNRENACSTRILRSRETGSTIIQVSYTGKEKLISKIRVTILDQVHIVKPKPNPQLSKTGLPSSLVIVGQETSLVVSGGKANDAIALLYRNPKTNTMDFISQDEWPKYLHFSRGTREREQRRYHISCVTEGVYEVIVQNSAHALFFCSHVARVELSVGEVLEQKSACSTFGTEKLPVFFAVENQAASLHVTLLDSEGRAFDDFGTLKWKWKIRPSHSKAYELVQVVDGKLVLPKAYRGEINLEVVLSMNTDLAASARVFVVEDISFDIPEFRTFFLHKNSKQNVGILGGEERLVERQLLECESTHPDAVLVSQNLRSMTLQYIGDNSKGDESLEIACSMSCLIGSNTIRKKLEISKVSRMKIIGPTKVKEGETVNISIVALDSFEKPFSALMHGFIDVELIASPKGALKVTLKKSPLCSSNERPICSDISCCMGEWVASIQGVRAGTAALQAKSVHQVVVAESRIQVYSGIKILPEGNALVEPGSSFRLTRLFGPFDDPLRCAFEMDEGHNRVLDITDQEGGLFYARKKGSARVQAICRGENGQVVDMVSVQVSVRYFSQMSIAPSTVFSPEGSRIRVRVHFPELESRIVDFQSISRTFKWFVSNTSVVDIESPLEDYFPNKRDYIVWFRAKNFGVTTVKVESIGIKYGAPKLVAEGVFGVEHRLGIKDLDSEKTVLIPRNGRLQIRTTLDSWNPTSFTGDSASLSFSVGSVAHSVPQFSIDGNVSTQGSSLPIQVDQSGLVRAFGYLGSAILVVQFRSEFRDVQILQQRTFSVSVSPVAFVSAKNTIGLHIFPIGVTRSLQVGLFDSSGESFASPFFSLNLRTHIENPSLVSVTKTPAESHNSAVFQVEALSEGTTLLVFYLDPVKGESAREEYIEIHVMSAESSFHFSVLDGPLSLIPTDTSSVALGNLTSYLIADGIEASCKAFVDSKKVYAYIEPCFNSDALKPGLCCKFVAPKHITQGSEFELHLLSGEKIMHKFTPEFELKFRVESDQVAIYPGSKSFEWDATQDTIHFTIIGLKNVSDLKIESSSPNFIKLARPLSKKSSSAIFLKRLRNETCHSTVSIMFENIRTGQKEILRADVQCSNPCQSLLIGENFFHQVIHWQTTITITVGLLLILACFCGCGPCVAGFFTMLSQKSQKYSSENTSRTFREMDSPVNQLHSRTYPRLARDEGLGSPLRMRPFGTPQN